jgi:uncharacterized coiled-coil protein SlyX
MNTSIIQLQEIIAHLEHDVSKLSQELYIQQKELAMLRIQVQQLGSQLRTAVDSSPVRSADQETPPPHY